MLDKAIAIFNNWQDMKLPAIKTNFTFFPSDRLIKFFMHFSDFPIFAAGKSYTASSYRTPPGSEDSKGMRLSGAM